MKDLNEFSYDGLCLYDYIRGVYRAADSLCALHNHKRLTTSDIENLTQDIEKNISKIRKVLGIKGEPDKTKRGIVMVKLFLGLLGLANLAFIIWLVWRVG